MTRRKTGVECVHSQIYLRVFDRFGERQAEGGDALSESNEMRKVIAIYAPHRSRKALLARDFLISQVVRIKTNDNF